MHTAQRGSSFSNNNIDRVMAYGDDQLAVFFVVTHEQANEDHPYRAAVHVMNMNPSTEDSDNLDFVDQQTIPEWEILLLLTKVVGLRVKTRIFDIILKRNCSWPKIHDSWHLRWRAGCWTVERGYGVWVSTLVLCSRLKRSIGSESNWCQEYR